MWKAFRGLVYLLDQSLHFFLKEEAPVMITGSPPLSPAYLTGGGSARAEVKHFVSLPSSCGW